MEKGKRWIAVCAVIQAIYIPYSAVAAEGLILCYKGTMNKKDLFSVAATKSQARSARDDLEDMGYNVIVIPAPFSEFPVMLKTGVIGGIALYDINIERKSDSMEFGELGGRIDISTAATNCTLLREKSMCDNFSPCE